MLRLWSSPTAIHIVSGYITARVPYNDAIWIEHRYDFNDIVLEQLVDHMTFLLFYSTVDEKLC